MWKTPPRLKTKKKSHFLWVYPKQALLLVINHQMIWSNRRWSLRTWHKQTMATESSMWDWSSSRRGTNISEGACVRVTARKRTQIVFSSSLSRHAPEGEELLDVQYVASRQFRWPKVSTWVLLGLYPNCMISDQNSTLTWQRFNSVKITS